MNDIVKENIKTKIEKALIAEGLTTAEAAGMIRVSPTYLSMMKNPKSWSSCSKAAWESVLAWVNSGQSLEKYGDNHGKVIVEKHDQKSNPIESNNHDPAVQTIEPTISLTYYKEQTDKAINEIKRLMKENTNLIKELNERKIGNILEAKECNPQSQRVCIDIEVNLIINGKKIEIK